MNSTSKAAKKLRELGMRGILVQIAETGQLIDIQCEMPQCYCPKGRKHFDRKAHPPGPWAPSPDHYPTLKSRGGQLQPENVRLSHVLCNGNDYGWRTKINTLLANGKTLEEIAEVLNRKRSRVPTGWRRGRQRGSGRPSSPRGVDRVRQEIAHCEALLRKFPSGRGGDRAHATRPRVHGCVGKRPGQRIGPATRSSGGSSNSSESVPGLEL